LQNQKPKIVIYGGNGFVGTHIAEHLSAHDLCIVCLSRTGHKPIHLNDSDWSKSVRWCKGDASNPDLELLAEAHTVIVLVGSAPIPTFSKQAFEKQFFNNGIAPAKAIEASKEAGVTRIILMGAHIPFFLNTDRFAYAKGKNMALESAKDFAAHSQQHGAVVMQPGAIYGKRHLKNGKVIPLDLAMSPASKIVPSQFIDVDRIAQRVTSIVLNPDEYDGSFTLLKNNEI